MKFNKITKARIIDQSKLEKALNYMVMLIENGFDFPDAAWKSADRFRTLNQYEIENAYDEKYATA